MSMSPNNPAPRRSRILLADDHALVRQGLRRILDAEPDLEVFVRSRNDPRRFVKEIECELFVLLLH